MLRHVCDVTLAQRQALAFSQLPPAPRLLQAVTVLLSMRMDLRRHGCHHADLQILEQHVSGPMSLALHPLEISASPGALSEPSI